MDRSRPVSYLAEVDGLRAVAVLSVMIYHLNSQLLPGGFVGVDVFFVISGYVVSKSIAERAFGDVWSYFLGFYARRIVRIVPALVWCLVVSTIVTILFIPQSWLSSSVAKTALSAFFGLSNFALVATNDGYFSPRVDYNPFVHTWSLAVEEQFYVVFPALFLVWLVLSGREGWRGQAAVAVLPFAIAVSLLIAIWLGRARPDWAFYLLPARFWELGAGALLYQLHARQRALARTPFEAHAGLVSGIGLIAAGFIWALPEAFPFPFALLPVLGSVLVIQAVARPEMNISTLHGVFRHPAVVYLGRISYSLYLWHWPIYTLFRWTVGLDGVTASIGAIGLTLAAAMFSFHVIEDPIRRSQRLRVSSDLAKVAGGIAAVVCLFVVSQQLMAHREELSLSVTRDRDVWYSASPSRSNLQRVANGFVGRKLFVVGNSHTLAYGTMLNETMRRLGVEVREQVVMTCNIGNLLLPMGESGECRQTLADVLANIKSAAKPGDIVFFASLRAPRLSRQWERYDRTTVLDESRSAEAKRDRKLALAEVSDLVAQLDEIGLKVLIDAPKPVFGAPPFRCADWFNRINPICVAGFSVDRAYMLALREPVMKSLDVLKHRFANVSVWDPLPVLCPGEICQAFDQDGQPLYYDGDHLSGHGNARLYPSFAQQLKSIWGQPPAS